MPKTIDPRIETMTLADKSQLLVVDDVPLTRNGPNGVKLAALLLTHSDSGDLVAWFNGGKYGPAQLHMFSRSVETNDGKMSQTSSADRLLAHFEGYCMRNDAGLVEGARVRFHTSGALRSVTILKTPKLGSKTVHVSGFTYKHGGQAKPRRVKLMDIQMVSSAFVK